MLLSCHDGRRGSDAAALQDRCRAARVLFLGRRELPERVEPAEALRRARGYCPELPSRVLYNEQCHSARVVEAGMRPEQADGLVTSSVDAALAVFTADCVPVLLAADAVIAALHAGWRGLAAAIVARGVAETAQRDGGAPDRLVAWIGPCIGGCCYEVSEEVAERVAAASAPDVVIPARPRPRLDLAGAAFAQLRAAGVEDVRWVRRCTRCAHDRWWSHRAEQGRAARNYAFVWRVAAAPGT